MLLFNYYYDIPTSFPTLNVTSVYYLAFIFVSSILLYFFNKSIIRKIIIFLLSLLFIWSFSNDFYFVIVSLLFCIYGYIVSYLIKHNKIVLIISILIPVVALVALKENLLSNSLIVPLGISFYVLRLIWYFNYIYSGKIEKRKSFLSLSNYLIFFPSYIAGPIENPITFFDEESKNEAVSYLNLKKGWVRLLYGIFEKVVICDYFGLLVERILPAPDITGISVFIGIVLYSFQIYLDFDSYSNIALGSASIIGIELNENFKTPYLSKNIKEFWSRWHISLSTWLKENIYIPLGGNKKGNIRKIINVVIVFVVSGLWHGSAFHFVLWGLAHALIRIIEDFIESKFPKLISNKVVSIFRIAINFLIVTFVWLLFRYENITEVTCLLSRLFVPSQTAFKDLLSNHEYIWMLILIVFVIVIDLIRYKFDIYRFIGKSFFIFRFAIYLIFIIAFLIFGVYGGTFEPSDFIYRWF